MCTCVIFVTLLFCIARIPFISITLWLCVFLSLYARAHRFYLFLSWFWLIGRMYAKRVKTFCSDQYPNSKNSIQLHLRRCSMVYCFGASNSKYKWHCSNDRTTSLIINRFGFVYECIFIAIYWLLLWNSPHCSFNNRGIKMYASHVKTLWCQQILSCTSISFLTREMENRWLA